MRSIKPRFVLLLLTLCMSISAQTPTPTPIPLRTPVGAQSVDTIKARIAERLMRADVRRGHIGVKIVSLNTGRVLFESNAEKYFMPASNMKNFTVATALEKLTPDYRLITSVYASAMPDADGVVKGLRIFGRGDISISYSFNGGDQFKGIDRLVDAIIASGVKRIEGEIIGDETFFKGNAVPGSWEWDDLQNYYGAEISALPLNDNVVNVSVTPGPLGYGCTVKITPYNLIFRVTNLCTTTAVGTPRTLRVEKKIDRNFLEITGTLPIGNPGFTGFISVSRPAELFVSMLKQRLELKGVAVTGSTRALNNRIALPVNMSVEIAELESPPLAVIAAKTMKPSQNMYTETLLWTLGEYARSRNNYPTVVVGNVFVNGAFADSAELGIGEVKSFLTSIGVPADGIIQHDGSGLSRHNLITPDAVVRLYTHMGTQSRFSQAWRDSLTIGGVDGTLRNRFRGTRASGNVRGKTGTIGQVSALSGYITTAAGEHLVFSMIVNGVNSNPLRVGLIDEIVVALANFDGRID